MIVSVINIPDIIDITNTDCTKARTVDGIQEMEIISDDKTTGKNEDKDIEDVLSKHYEEMTNIADNNVEYF